MGSGPGPAPPRTSFAHKAPRVEAFFLEKLIFLPEPLRPHPNEDPNLKKKLRVFDFKRRSGRMF